MKKSTIVRFAGFIGAAGVTAALVGSAVAGTGAYFSDSKTGTVAGTLGSIKVTTGTTALSFDNMLPGETTTKSVTFTNTGLNAQDVWVVFNDADMGDHDHLTDTNRINDHGTFGSVVIAAGGVQKFLSNNLNDDPISCPVGAGTAPFQCNPVPHMLKLASNLGPTGSSDMSFSYTPAAKLKSAAQEGLPAFVTINYTIVATQVGITPDNSLNTVPVP